MKLGKNGFRNIFAELGYDKDEINARVRKCFDTIFNGSDEERFYFDVGDDMGYITDTGNNDVRTEGMSYGMMMCVQMDEKEKFDRIWKWVKTYMWMSNPNWNKGYFIWSCNPDGSARGEGPAPDGEEFFAMALFLASHKWGDGIGIYDYSAEAKAILSACIHNGEPGRFGEPMWNRENHLIKFITCVEFSDPSYHLPHFYEYFSEWADYEDRDFWKKAAEASREYLVKACHPVTGMSAEYAAYDGTPYREVNRNYGGVDHGIFFSDAYRTVANIGLDSMWTGSKPELAAIAERLIGFFEDTRNGVHDGTYETDGTLIEEKTKHYIGLLATNAQGALAVYNNPDATENMLRHAENVVRKFWNTPMRTDGLRYYDNCLYMFAMLALSGNYRVW